MLIQTVKENDMNIPEWLIEMQIVLMVCGGISLAFTLIGGYALISWLESLKGESDDESVQD